MDRTIAKTLTKDEKVIKEFTFSSKFINIFMALSLIKWLLIFGVLSAVLFFAIEFNEFAPPIDLPMIDMDKLNNSSEESLKESLAGKNFIEGSIAKAWAYPIAIFIFIAFPIVIFYYQYYLRIANRYVLTESRIMFKRGWLSTEVESIHYDRITDVLVTQSIWDKFIFGVGKLFINTAGGEDYEAKMVNIRDPHEMKKKIYSLKNKNLERNNNEGA